MPVRGLATTIPPLRPPRVQSEGGEEGAEGPGVGPTGGGSDDIGDVSWNVPTVTLRYPSNIPGGPGHNWANGVSMATPIAHKGVMAGAKVQAMTMLDILLHPELVKNAWDYFNNVQTKDMKYNSFLRPDDKPAIWLNAKTMDKYRDEMKKYYYDPTKYDNYLRAARNQVSDGEIVTLGDWGNPQGTLWASRQTARRRPLIPDPHPTGTTAGRCPRS